MLFRQGFSIQQVARPKREPVHLLAELIVVDQPCLCQARIGAVSQNNGQNARL